MSRQDMVTFQVSQGIGEQEESQSEHVFEQRLVHTEAEVYMSVIKPLQLSRWCHQHREVQFSSHSEEIERPDWHISAFTT